MRIIGLLIAAAILVAATVADVPGQPRTPTPGWQKLDDKSARFLILSKDLSHIAQTLGQIRQRDDVRLFEQAASSLSTSAITVSGYLAAARDLLWIYDHLSSPIDRATVKPYINAVIEHYSKLCETEIKPGSLDLIILTSSGFTTTADQLKDEVREAVMLLKSVAIK